MDQRGGRAIDQDRAIGCEDHHLAGGADEAVHVHQLADRGERQVALVLQITDRIVDH